MDVPALRQVAGASGCRYLPTSDYEGVEGAERSWSTTEIWLRGATNCAGIGSALEGSALSGQLIWGKLRCFLADR